MNHKFLLAAAALTGFAAHANAATIVQFDFEGTPAATATTVDPGVTASPFTVTGPGTVRLPNLDGDNDGTPFASAPGSTFNSASITQGTGVFSFTLTVNDSTAEIDTLQIDSFQFSVSQINFSPSPTFNVTSSLTGGTSLASGTFGSSVVGDNPFTTITVDVTDPAFDSITEGESVTFNITATAGSDTTGTIRVDKIDVQGTVSSGAIPEPASLALLGLGGLLLIGRGRRA